MAKLKLVEVSFVFHVPVPGGGGDWDQVMVHAGLHHRKLYLSFGIGGAPGDRETLPSTLVDGIKAAIDYAGKHVQVRDLVEIDPELEFDEKE